ncbi:MAG: hypothetical protein R3D58_08615 [Saprospiraceae bacterium]
MKANAIVLLGAVLLLQACASHGPAYLGNAGTYMAKPTYEGKTAGAVYFSGAVNKGHVYYKGEKNNSFEMASHVSFMWRHFYLAGGLFGYGGKYKTKAGSTPSTLPKASYGFNGFGFRMEIGGRLELNEKTDLLLGVHESFFGQSGALEEASGDAFENFFTDVFTLGTDGATAGLNAEIRFSPAAKRSLGLRYSFESVAGDISDPPVGYQYLENIHRLSLHATIDRVTAFGQLGFTDTGQQVYNIGLSVAVPFWQKTRESNR